MAFSSDVIEKDSFKIITELFKKYQPIHQVGDQPTFNLYFYKKWKNLIDNDPFYNPNLPH